MALQVKGLTIALCFHQLLEAIALGSFVVRAGIGRVAGMFHFFGVHV
jgi:hypothetical protein